MAGVGWKLHGDGKHLRPGEVVRPDERLSWGRTLGLGAQHVVSMIGACFIAPVLMGLDPSLALMASGAATALFLLMTRGRIPSYLGSSLSFVGVSAVIASQGGDAGTLTGALLVVGACLAGCGIVIHVLGARAIHAVLPPAVTGAVVMLIGFNLAPVTASTYWPQDQWTALATMLFTGLALVVLRGFWARIAIFLGLVFGYGLSWIFDKTLGKIHSADGSGRSPITGGSTSPGSPKPTGSACPPSTPRISPPRRSWSPCPSWWRSSPRTQGTSRRSVR